MSDQSLIQQIIMSVLRWLDRKSRKQPQLEGYSKTTEFKARSGAWLMIVLYGLLIAVVLFVIITEPYDENPDIGILWIDVLWIFCIVICILAMRHNISMLKARIIVGPEMLILDGAMENTPKRGWKRWWIGAQEESDLVVEIPWACISLLATDFPTLVVETYNKERYLMELSLFDIKVTREISKYHKVEEIAL